MEIKKATAKDAPIMHQLMIKAYIQYENIPGSSTALDETVEAIRQALETNEHGLIVYENDIPLGTVRYRLEKDELFFLRLSVLPEERGRGIGRLLLKHLEQLAEANGKEAISCYVRMDLTRNMNMYKSYGYKQVKQFIEVIQDIKIDVVKVRKDLL